MKLIGEGLNHFWSTDGIECLWCRRKRTPEEIAAWKAAGKPDEPCTPLKRNADNSGSAAAETRQRIE